MRYTTDGTYKENLKSTASLYVVVIPHGIGEAVLISLTARGVLYFAFDSLNCFDLRVLTMLNKKYAIRHVFFQ